MTLLRDVCRTCCIPVLLGSIALLAGPHLSGATLNRLGSPIVITQVPSQSDTGPAQVEPTRPLPADWPESGRLVVVTPDGQVRLLSEGFQSACDPSVSFDGRRILFAAKKKHAEPWRIWEVGADGEGLRPVSPEYLDARHPIYAATLFTLDSPEPWSATVFMARVPILNELGQPAVSSLYNVKLDGTDLRRLTFNPNRNLDPFQMWDGRLIYVAERFSHSQSARESRMGLYAIHVEGSDMEFYGAGQGKRIQQMPCATDQHLVVFIESDELTSDGAGQLACVEERRPHVSYRPLTQDPSFAYRHPSPLKGNRILVSRRATCHPGTWGVFSFDTERAWCDLVFDSPDYHEMQAALIESRNPPDGHSTVVDTKYDAGILYGLNCYDADLRLAPHIQTGMVKRVRFVEGVPQSEIPGQSPTSSGAPYVLRRLVGEAPVEPDGSFNVEVPADIPLLLQTLDEDGLALATCGWIWVKPKEKRGCIGCHEDPERIPENLYALALRRPSNRLLLPPQDRRVITFREDVAPILQRQCATAGCHGGHDTPLHLPLPGSKPSEDNVRQAYTNLLLPTLRSGSAGTASAGRYIDPGTARRSWLVWQIAGRDTSRPWDHDLAETAREMRKVTPMPPAGKGEPLGPEAQRTIIQWIDMGAQYAAPEGPLVKDRVALP